MSEPQAFEVDLETMMRRIRDEVARRKAMAPHAVPAPPDSPAATQHAGSADAALMLEPVALPRLPESEGSIERKSGYVLSDFLRFHDEDFVRNAYRGILRREPDPEGFVVFLDGLRSGRLAKTEILGEMRFSAEGRAAAVPVRGLALPLALRSARRIPLAGRLLGVVQYLFRLPDLVRNHERLEAAFFHRQLEMKRGVNAAEAQIELEMGRIQQRVFESGGAAAASMERVRNEMANSIRAGRHLQARLFRRVRSEMATSSQATALETGMGTLQETVRSLVDSAPTRQEFESRFIGVERALEFKADSEHLTNLTNHFVDLLQRKLDALADKTASQLESLQSAETQRDARIAEDDHLLDAFYVSFEDRFRGTMEDIRKRVEIYLPVIQEAAADTPVLDIGCGRGEWLELLKESGLTARGVDLNRVMAARCRERGLEVIEGDAVEYLSNLEPGSLGAVTGMHVIEHIPFRRLLALFDEVFRVLRSGGVAIFETPNPENLLVGACNFYCDPTHERPLPPEPMQFVAEARGFERVEIRRLHPFPESFHLTQGAPAIRERLNQVLYGPQDYALVAYKP